MHALSTLAEIVWWSFEMSLHDKALDTCLDIKLNGNKQYET